MPLLFLEFLGTTELLVIMVVALVIFGPRKLPQIGHSIGKSLSEFKRASEDFKRTWETEVKMEVADKEARIENAIQPASPAAPVYARGADDEADSSLYSDPLYSSPEQPAPAAETPATEAAPAVASVAGTPRKQDWL